MAKYFSSKTSMIKERILQIAKRKGVTNRKICQKIGLTYGGFTGENKKRPVNSDAIANLLVEYPDVNPRWLLTGQGSMLREQSAPEVAPPPSEPAFPGFIEKIQDLSVKVGRLEAENEHFRAAIEAKQREIEAQRMKIEARQKEIEDKERQIKLMRIDLLKKEKPDIHTQYLEPAHAPLPPEKPVESAELLKSQPQEALFTP